MSMTVNSVANGNISTLQPTSKTPKVMPLNPSKNPSAIAISERMNSYFRGLEQGVSNTGNMSDLLRTAEGGLSSINTSLQRIRELSLQSMNATTSDEDRKMIQGEINQMKAGINSVVQQTEFNSMALLGGKFVNKNTASSAYGLGQQVSIEGMSTEDLGIENYDVTQDFDIEDIDIAMEKVAQSESRIGASMNTMNYSMNSSNIAMANLQPSRSRLSNVNMELKSVNQNKYRVLSQYQAYLLKRGY